MRFLVLVLALLTGCVAAEPDMRILTIRYGNEAPYEVRVATDVRVDGENRFSGEVPVPPNATMRPEFTLLGKHLDVTASFAAGSRRVLVAFATQDCPTREIVDIRIRLAGDGTLVSASDSCSGRTVLAD